MFSQVPRNVSAVLPSLFITGVCGLSTREGRRMEVLVSYFGKLAGPPDEPAALFSREFFGRAYSWSNDGWVMTWASLATRAC